MTVDKKTTGGFTLSCGCRGSYYGDECVTEHYCSFHVPGTRIFDSPVRTLRPSTETEHPLGTNPKDLLGISKVSITKVPAVALLHTARAMMDGARKYNSFNWRANKVQADIYVDAAFRHLSSWFEREEIAPDSGVHHLGHAMACLAILLDAQETGNLVDNRPKADGTYQKVLSRLNAEITKAGK